MVQMKDDSVMQPPSRWRRPAVLITIIGGVVVGLLVFPRQRMDGGSGYVGGYKYILQYQVHEGVLGSDKRPLYAVLWKSGPEGSYSTHYRREVVISGQRMRGSPEAYDVDGHPVAPSLEQKAVYALQSDYTLKQIPLSDQEVDRVLALMENSVQTAGFKQDDLWQTRIEPCLRLVEPAQKGNVPATNLASVPSGTE